MEIIAVQGDAYRLKELADKLIGLKGIRISNDANQLKLCF